MIAFPGKLTENGKIKYVPRKPKPGELDYWFGNEYRYDGDNFEGHPIMIPCGKCIACRLSYSREWAARCMLELKDHDSAYFVTATYSDEEVPKSYFSDPDTGEALPSYTLRKRDFQLWLKNIRADFPDDKIRFYGCGEYGSHTFRPHYHVILFGLHLDDLSLYKRTETGLLYNSDKLSATWFRFDPVQRLHFPRGYVVVAPVTWDTCAYVARYTAKKYMTLGDDFFDEFNMEKPFVLMSRRPGIGKNYLERHPELFDSKALFVPSGDGVKRSSIPRYFYKCLERSDPDLCEALKEKRQRTASVYQQALINSSSRSYESLLDDSRRMLLAKAKSLQRDL